MGDTINELKTFNKPFVNVNFYGTGPFTVIDSLKANNINIRGAVKFSPVTQCNSIKVENKDASSLDISGSHVYVNNFILDVLPVNFKSDNSTIFLTSLLQGTGYSFNKIIVSGNVYISTNKIDTLHISESCTLYLPASGEIEVKKLIATGTGSNYLTIRGNNSFIKNTIEADTINFVILDKVHASGMASIFAPDCIQKNGSSGWIGAKYFQVINYTMIENVPVTEESVTIQATSTSELPVFMKLIRGDGNLENNVFYPHGKGMVEIEISQEGGVNNSQEFVSAENVSVFFQVYDESDPFEIYDFKEASMIIGQESFDTVVNAVDSLHFRGSFKCAVSSQGMFAASTSANGGGRILIWKNIPDKLGQPADIVLGRLGFNQGTGGTSA